MFHKHDEKYCLKYVHRWTVTKENIHLLSDYFSMAKLKLKEIGTDEGKKNILRKLFSAFKDNLV